MRIFVKDKSFYHKLLSISVPIALQNLITFGVNMMDTVMVGQLGEAQLTATSLANQVGFVFMIINFGLTGGASILTAQYWGRGDGEAIKRVMGLTYRISIGMSLIFSVLSFFTPGFLMRIFTTDEAVIAEGVRYLRIMAFTYGMYGITLTSISLLRTVGTVKISLAVYSLSFVVNVFFNWVFIFGHLGAPRMEIVGAALGTLIARVSEFLFIGIYMLAVEKKICFRIRYLFSRCGREITEKFIRYSAPVMGNEVLWSLGDSMITVIMGRLGSEMVAAFSICRVLMQFTTVLVQGISNSAAVITGNTIGEGEYQKAKDQARTFFFLSVIFGVFACALMLLIKHVAIDFYNVSDATKALAYQLMTVMAVMMIFQSVGSVNLIGTLRGGGDSKFVFLCDVGSMWVCSVFLGFLAGIVIGLPSAVTFIFLKSDQVAKSVACVGRLFRGKWVRDVTR